MGTWGLSASESWFLHVVARDFGMLASLLTSSLYWHGYPTYIIGLFGELNETRLVELLTHGN